MSTRGLIGYRKNNQDILFFQMYDSYPEHLGRLALMLIKETNSTDELIYKLQDYLLKEQSGHLEINNQLIYNSLTCEYAYIYNLDTNKFEFWIGFQYEPQQNNRYGIQVTYVSSYNNEKYYPCKLALEIELDTIRQPSFLIDTCVEQMENLS